MLCIRCGHDSPEGSKFCHKCNAKLLHMAPTGNPMSNSLLDLDDTTNIITPEKRYITEHIYHLTACAYDYLHKGEPGEPLLEAFQVIKSRMEEFQNEALPEIVAQLQAERSNYPDLDFAPQILYQINHGTKLVEEGVGYFESFIESGDEEVLIAAVTCMQDGNDHICLANELIVKRGALLEQVVKLMQEGVEAPTATANVSAPAASPAEPEPAHPIEDSSDLA